MRRDIQVLLIIAALILCACDRHSDPTGSEPDKETEDIQWSPAGTYFPILEHDRFMFLCWYELIDIGADVLLDEYLDPSAEWRLSKIKEAGFDIYFDYRLDSLEEAEALLELGDKVGMKIITECPELHDPATTQMAIEAMSAHPSLYAYNVWDEPDLVEYPEVLRRLKEIYSYDKTRPCYVNLYPNYGIDEWTEENYLTSLRHYLQSLPVSFLSFDYYPVIMKEGERTLRDAWYHNLEDIRTAALEADVPIWAFAMSKALGSNPKPTLADLRLQQFSNLVYGAVVFQYFTARGIVWEEDCTDVYPYIKQVNEELKQMEDIFLGADIKGIWHTGTEIPRGTKALTAYPEGISKIQTGDEGMVVSHFTNNGREYIALVNRSCTAETTLEIAFKKEASCIAKNGTESPATTSYRIEPGDIMIFAW